MKKLLIMSAVAVCVSLNSLGANITTCADCYKCVQYSGASCVRCEYDANYCMQVEHDCALPKTWCASENTCKCPALCSDSGFACVGTVNPSTCECESMEIEMCLSGYYLKGTICVECPAYSGATTTCTPESSGDSGITSCYYPNGCEFSDETGTFILTENCDYSLIDSIVDDGGELLLP